MEENSDLRGLDGFTSFLVEIPEIGGEILNVVEEVEGFSGFYGKI